MFKSVNVHQMIHTNKAHTSTQESGGPDWQWPACLLPVFRLHPSCWRPTSLCRPLNNLFSSLSSTFPLSTPLALLSVQQQQTALDILLLCLVTPMGLPFFPSFCRAYQFSLMPSLFSLNELDQCWCGNYSPALQKVDPFAKHPYSHLSGILDGRPTQLALLDHQ